MAFFGISAFAILAAAAAMYSFLEVSKALDKITLQRVPSALSSLEISRQAERIVAAAPALLTVNTPIQRKQLSAKIATEIERLDALLLNLQGSSNSAVLESIEHGVQQLRANLDALDALVGGRLEAREHKNKLLRRLLNTHNAAQRLITPGLMVVEGDLSQLQQVLDAPDLSSDARIASVSGLVEFDRHLASSPEGSDRNLEHQRYAASDRLRAATGRGGDPGLSRPASARRFGKPDGRHSSHVARAPAGAAQGISRFGRWA